MAMAAFPAVQAVPIACELPPPALQCGELHAQQPGQFAGPGTSAIPSTRICKAFWRSIGEVSRPSSLPRGPEFLFQPFDLLLLSQADHWLLVDILG